MKAANKPVLNAYLANLKSLYGSNDDMRAKKIDANQNEIVEKLRELGATVQILSQVGQGCPDILVGVNGYNFLVEIKDGNKVKSARKLTNDQIRWHQKWRGNVFIIDNINAVYEFFDIANKFLPLKSKPECSTCNIRNIGND